MIGITIDMKGSICAMGFKVNLFSYLAVGSPSVSDQTQKRKCPKCEDTIMMRNFFSIKKEVEVDHCPKCAGYWLDENELFKIRKQFDSESDRKQAAEQYFTNLFDDELRKMEKESEDRAQQAQKIAKMFRLICPSYYFSKIKN